MEDLGPLSEEFVERYRRGERPSITEYVNRNPDLADEIRELFPTLASMEQLVDDELQSGEFVRSHEMPESLGDYVVIREIARGGMGIVYEAEEKSLGRRVALKVLPPLAIIDPTQLQRFRREVRAAGQLHHSNIVPVFGVGEENGTHFYAMQFIDGVSLDHVLKDVHELRRLVQDRSLLQPSESQFVTADQGTSETESGAVLHSQGLSSSQGGLRYYKSVANVGLQVANALAYAHQQGVVHRDIKPGNLLLDTLGKVWVADFGLAKIEGEDITTTGEYIGTLRYMAPERFHGWVDPRSDIYSLGLTLYEMLTLQPAFAANDRPSLIRAIADEEPTRIRRIDPSVPRDLETIILKATSKEPQSRYRSAAEFAEDLRRFNESKPIAARRSNVLQRVWLWGKRNPLAGALAVSMLGLLLAGIGGLYFGNRSLSAHLNSAHAARQQSQQNLFDSYLEQVQSSTTSSAPGRRFRGLAAIRDCVQLGTELGDFEAKKMQLRNQAVVLLTMFDVQKEQEWG